MARGRPTKLTKKVIDAICDAVNIGASWKLAAAYAGISDDTLEHWVALARAEHNSIEAGNAPDEGNKKYLSFLRQLEEATANASIKWLQVVEKTAENDPIWAWKLLTVHNQEYILPDKHELTGKDGESIKIEGEQIISSGSKLDEAISSLADALREAVPGEDAGEKSAMASAEQTSVAGAPIDGR